MVLNFEIKRFIFHTPVKIAGFIVQPDIFFPRDILFDKPLINDRLILPVQPCLFTRGSINLNVKSNLLDMNVIIIDIMNAKEICLILK